MKSFLGIEYSRGARAIPADGGPMHAPRAIQKMFPTANWTFVTAAPCDTEKCRADRFGDALVIQKQIFDTTPNTPHILIGGDHSVNFGHFAALADQIPNSDLCLIYIDAHLDIHTPQSSLAEASGAPHGTNVRALMGDGDARWLALQKRRPALRPENLFCLGIRSYEPSEIKFVTDNNIYIRRPAELGSPDDTDRIINEIRQKIGNRPYVVSFDFDAIDPGIFPDVWVPEPNGISTNTAEQLIRAFAPNAYGFEFVEYAPSGDIKSAKIVQNLVRIVAE